MAENEEKNADPQNTASNVISGILIDREKLKIYSPSSTIISGKSQKSSGKVKVIGGDSDDIHENPPAIIIEKDGDKISKIMVKCPCGRHSELICEYNDEQEDS